ncbi:MAG: hypothetical protein ACUVWZ_07200 [Anaerolineae bacterium]
MSMTTITSDRTAGGLTQPPQGHEDLNQRVLEIGRRALNLLRYYGLEQISTDELITRLPELGAQAVLARHWDLLAGNPAYAASFQVLQLVTTLEAEADYQIRTYGPDSLYEDFRELELAVGRLRKEVTSVASEHAPHPDGED